MKCIQKVLRYPEAEACDEERDKRVKSSRVDSMSNKKSKTLWCLRLLSQARLECVHVQLIVDHIWRKGLSFFLVVKGTVGLFILDAEYYKARKKSQQQSSTPPDEFNLLFSTQFFLLWSTWKVKDMSQALIKLLFKLSSSSRVVEFVCIGENTHCSSTQEIHIIQ